MLNALMKKLKLDKDKNEGIRKIGNVTKGVVSSLEQCSGQTEKRRRRKTEIGRIEGVRQIIGRQIGTAELRREDTRARVAADYP
jgi:hypothetical protein